jgi:hypothetical protein
MASERTQELYRKMIDYGISGTNLVFSQSVISCMNMDSESSGIKVVTPKTNNNSKPNSVTLQYTTTGANGADLTGIMDLICRGDNGISHATVLMSPDVKGAIFLSVTIDNSLTKREFQRPKFLNRVTDNLKLLRLGAANTAVGMDIQRYMININQNQCTPLWRVELSESVITLHADCIVELDLFHIRPLMNRWPKIIRVVYSARPASKNGGETIDATYPFVPTISFTYERTPKAPDEGEDGEILDSKAGRQKRAVMEDEEDNAPPPKEKKKWFGIF